MRATNNIIHLSERSALNNASKRKLIDMVLSLRSELNHAKEESNRTICLLQKTLSEKESELEKLKKSVINQTVNQPSSKQPEFNKKTTSKTDEKKKKKRKSHKGRKGAGNRQKPNPDVFVHNELNHCPQCQTDLSDASVIDTQSRIIEDIPPIPEKTIVSQEIQERKWCPTCAEIVSASSEAALSKSDIGLRALCLIAYLWVVSAISMPGITAFLKNFFCMTISTAGVSKMMIRLAKIMNPVYDEILQDVKGGMMIFADETGWRVKGVLWWLWIFANKTTAYYFPSKLRSSAVVENILGTVFSGVLITDAWYAYMKIVCVKQTCMAHILRKIRKFRDAYPQYYTIIIFYKKLRRILLDGEKLKSMRNEIDEERFSRRLNLLKERLRELLACKNPNNILQEIIAKVRRQEAYILTFVEHDGVPNHNNFGEYIIKKGILKRKVSGGSMSEEGVMAYAIIQSIAQTCYLRNISFLQFLKSSLVHYIRTGAPLSLKEYESQYLYVQKEAA